MGQISSHEITLSATSIADLPTLFEFQLDSEAQYLAAFMPANAADKVTYIDKYTRFLADPTIFMKTIWIGDVIAGSIAKYETEGNAEITYWIDRKYWGRGLASTAIELFLNLESTRPIYGRTAFDNFGSQKVLDRAGFKKIGTDKGFASARQLEIEEYIYLLE